MFRKRENEQLKARIAKLADRCADLTRERDAAVRLNGRLAQKTTAATEHANRAANAWGVVVKDANQAEALFARSMRVRRAESRRLRRIIDDQRRQLSNTRAELQSERERSSKLDSRLATMQTANEAEDWRFIRRAGPASNSPENALLQKAS